QMTAARGPVGKAQDRVGVQTGLVFFIRHHIAHQGDDFDLGADRDRLVLFLFPVEIGDCGLLESAKRDKGGSRDLLLLHQCQDLLFTSSPASSTANQTRVSPGRLTSLLCMAFSLVSWFRSSL